MSFLNPCTPNIYRWGFVDNDNISSSEHLERDGIHLNPIGVKTLAMNIISHLRGENPQRGNHAANSRPLSSVFNPRYTQREEQFQQLNQSQTPPSYSNVLKRNTSAEPMLSHFTNYSGCFNKITTGKCVGSTGL